MENKDRLTVRTQIDESEMDLIDKGDPNFSLKYAALFEEKEKGIAEKYTFQNENGRVDYVFIKREIPILINGERYYDITTAYGYGGPVIVYSHNEKELLSDYFIDFHDYCLNHNIVSEFVRFHLFESNRVRKHYYGEVSEIGSHIVKPLNKALRLNMNPDVNRSLNKARKLGVTIHFDTTGSHLNDFLAIYNETMKRNKASDYYYFNETFFKKLHEDFEGQFVYGFAEYDGNVISSRLAVYGEKYSFGFLGGTLKQYFNTHATTAVDYSILNYLKDKQCSYFSFGGGYRDHDGIYKYKKKFNKKGDCPFYVGKKIHLPVIYDELVITYEKTKSFDRDSTFFPLYRA